jgi:tetratricopeptide (TPR) repeat protein
MVMAGETKRAESEFAGIKKVSPGNPLGYVKSAELFISQGKMDRAVSEYEQALKASPQSWRVANDLAFLLGELSRDIDRAIMLADKARTLNPEELNVQDTLGWLYYKKGETAKAMELLNPLLTKAPDAAVIKYHLGMVLIKDGKASEGKALLNKALARNEKFPGRVDAERALARL